MLFATVGFALILDHARCQYFFRYESSTLGLSSGRVGMSTLLIPVSNAGQDAKLEERTE